MKKLRIFLAEDHALVREGLKLLIDSQPDMEVVGEADEGKTSVARARDVSPGLAIVDVVLPGINGALVAERMIREIPGIRVLALTARHDLAYIRQMMSAGASGYVLKLTKPSDFLHAVRTVAAGGIHVDPHVARTTVGNDITAMVTTAESPRPNLTRRDIELIQLIARGHSNKEIGEHLEVSVKSVETYKTRVMDKLGFRSRVQLIQFVIHQGWFNTADVD